MGSTPRGISASRGASFLGLSKWKTQVQAWLEICEEREPGFCEKNGYILKDDEDAVCARWGLAFEDAIVKLAESKKNGVKILDREKSFKANVEGPVEITCHIDGNYIGLMMKYPNVGPTIAPPPILHEGKTTNLYTFRDEWGDPGTDAIPREYQVQCQHQMLCTGADQVIVSVLVFPKRTDEWENEGWTPDFCGGDDYWIVHEDSGLIYPGLWAESLDQMGFFHQYTINRDQALIDLMVKEYTAFWDDHVLTGIPPKPVNLDDIKRLTPEPSGVIYVTPEIAALFQEDKQIRTEISPKGDLGKRRVAIRTQILNFGRSVEPTFDEIKESPTRWIFRDEFGGGKLGSFDGKAFR